MTNKDNNYLDATVANEPIEEASETIEPEQVVAGVFKPHNLTKKQKLFVNKLVDNPKMSPSQAVREVYNIGGKGGMSAPEHISRQMARENLQKPAIVMALGEHSDLFESAIVGVVSDWKTSDSPRKREIALDAAKFGHDKIHGKSTVKIEQQTNIVQIAINLTGDGEQPPDDLIDLS